MFYCCWLVMCGGFGVWFFVDVYWCFWVGFFYGVFGLNCELVLLGCFFFVCGGMFIIGFLVCIVGWWG